MCFLPRQANEKRDSVIKKWTNASLPTCHPGEMAPLLARLLFDSSAIETASPSSQDPGHITASIKTPALRPVVPVPSTSSPQHITILRPRTSVDSTHNQMKIIPSIKTLPSTPKVILKVVRTQSGMVSNQPPLTSSSSRRKIHSRWVISGFIFSLTFVRSRFVIGSFLFRPAHVTEISSNATASAGPPLNIQVS